MKREEMYPNTAYFCFHNANPKNKFTSDCVIRAISTATKTEYNQVLRELVELQCNLGYDISDKKLFSKYLEQRGWKKQKQPRKKDNTKYTGKQFCKLISKKKEFPPYIIANIGGHHIVAIVYGRIFDTWDSSEGCIGNYWIPKEFSIN